MKKSIDIDECNTGKSNCAIGTATCTNTIGSFTCACISGYSGNGVYCNGNTFLCFISFDFDFSLVLLSHITIFLKKFNRYQ